MPVARGVFKGCVASSGTSAFLPCLPPSASGTRVQTPRGAYSGVRPRSFPPWEEKGSNDRLGARRGLRAFVPLPSAVGFGEGIPLSALGFGDAVPLSAVGFGDAVPLSAVGFGEGIPLSAVGFGEAVPLSALGFGEGIPLSALGFGDALPLCARSWPMSQGSPGTLAGLRERHRA